MCDYMVEVKDLKQHFKIKKGGFGHKNGVVKAVDGVSFKIKRGTTMGFVGESGCGKSTVARTMLNLIKPTEGKVVFDGQVIYDSEQQVVMNQREMMKLRKDMQIIFQDPYACLDPRMKIWQIVSEGIKKHEKVSKNEALNRAEALLLQCGLGKEHLFKYPHQFSGGQRQRIGIARALSLNPKFIVCDEPTAALDVSIQSQILNLMLSLKKDFSLTYLFISHDLSVVKNFCDEICVMYLGGIVEKATAEEIYQNTKHPYAKALISAAPKFGRPHDENRILLEGEIPSPANPPQGCRFHTRCPQVWEKCKRERPTLKEVEQNHFVACHLYEQ